MITTAIENIPKRHTIFVSNPLTIVWNNEKVLVTFLLLFKRYRFKVITTNKRKREHRIELYWDDSISSTYFWGFLKECSRFLDISVGWSYRRFPFLDSKCKYILIERLEIRDMK